MSAVAKTLWMIESRFGMPLTLEEMAVHAGVSRFHLSRIFPRATGYSISAYLRGRRLTEAAKALAAGAPDILAVALDAGYGSHEAFTRAFRELIGLTPDEVRRRRRLDDLPLLEPLRIDHEVPVELCAPRIESLPPMRVAGLLARHTNGLAGRYFPETGECEYMAGMEVTDTAELPREFTAITVPAQRYARLMHRGHITTIRSTIEAIFDQWLPSSGYRRKHAPWTFIEYYGPDFNEHTGLGTVEIWIALED